MSFAPGDATDKPCPRAECEGAMVVERALRAVGNSQTIHTKCSVCEWRCVELVTVEAGKAVE